MRRHLLLLAAAALVASAIFAYPALSTPTTPTASVNARLRAVEGKVRTLQNQVRVLKAQNGQIGGALACLKGAWPVTRFTGYVYTPDGVTVQSTTALDFTDQGEQPHAWLSGLDPNCVRTTAQFKAMPLRLSAKRSE